MPLPVGFLSVDPELEGSPGFTQKVHSVFGPYCGPYPTAAVDKTPPGFPTRLFYEHLLATLVLLSGFLDPAASPVSSADVETTQVLELLVGCSHLHVFLGLWGKNVT